MKRLNRTMTSALVLSVWVATSVHGQTVEPKLSYVFPAGAQRGTEVDVRVGGLHFFEYAKLEILGDGVSGPTRVMATDTLRFNRRVTPQSYFGQELEFPRDYAAKFRVAADAAMGLRYIRAWTSQGAAGPIRFVVGDLPEVIEEEVNGDPIPERVTLPVTANGRIYPREDVDVWSFEARAGEAISCEVYASRLGSGMDSLLQIRDKAGVLLAENTQYFDNDAFLRFTAPEDGEYFVHIADMRFGGHQSFVYRLTITNQSYVDTFYPLGGRRGEKVALELVGAGLPEKGIQVALPLGGPSEYLPRVELDEPLANTVFLDVADLPERREEEPNDEPTAGAVFAAPVMLNGRIDKAGDVDHWAFDVKKGESLQFAFRARRIGTPLMPLLIVVDGEGKELQRTESGGGFTAPADGRYYVRVEEQFGPRGGPDFVYRVAVNPTQPLPDFRLRMGRNTINVFRASKDKPPELPLKVERSGGFGGPIELEVSGLPEGVTVSGTTIPAGKNDTVLKFVAGPETKIVAGRVTIIGVGQADGFRLTRTATFKLDQDLTELDTLLVAVGLSTPFRFHGLYELPFALRGTTHYRYLQLDRGEYEGLVHVRMADRQIRHQQGTWGRQIVVQPGSNEFEYPLEVSLWTAVGLTCRSVLVAYAEVEDFDGTKHTVAYTSSLTPQQVMMQPNAEPVSVKVERPAVVAPLGDTTLLKVSVARDEALRLPVKVQLVLPRHVHGVKAVPIEIPMGESEGVLKIELAKDAGPFNAPMTVRAVAHLDADLTVRTRVLRQGDSAIAEAKVRIVVANQ